MEDLLPCERFTPMDDELLFYYLEPRVNENMPVPGVGEVIFEEDLYGQDDLWTTWKKYEEQRTNDLRRSKDLFFFTTLKNSSANRIKRMVGSGGTWKEQVSGKPVYLLEDEETCPKNTLLGYRKIFTYKKDKSPQDGCWIMYQFELDESRIINKEDRDHVVLCQLRKNDDKKKIAKKRGRVSVDEEEEEEGYLQEEKRVRVSSSYEGGDEDRFLLEQEHAFNHLPPSLLEEVAAVVASTTIEEDGNYDDFLYRDLVPAEVDWELFNKIMQEDEQLSQTLCFREPEEENQQGRRRQKFNSKGSSGWRSAANGR